MLHCNKEIFLLVKIVENTESTETFIFIKMVKMVKMVKMLQMVQMLTGPGYIYWPLSCEYISIQSKELHGFS